jgi:hypothetical protein
MWVSNAKHPSSIFDTETSTWSTLEPMPLSSSSHSANVLDGEQVYIVGAGNNGKGVLRFDTASGVWSTLGATSNKKRTSATFVVGGCLHVAGGSGELSGVERYDVATDTWTAVAKFFFLIKADVIMAQSQSGLRSRSRSRTSSTRSSPKLS